MTTENFDITLSDSQGTEVEPVSPQKFDVSAYHDYEASLLEQNDKFWRAKSGIAVHRRFRVPQVFSRGCRDMKKSLAWQLGALQKSMSYEMDIANFLEPWYGIGTIATAFGINKYEWKPGQAPAFRPPFKSVDEALEQELLPIEETSIGKQTLEMIHYFLDQTKGQIPISPTDTQASLNAASFLIDTHHFFLEFVMNPQALKELLDKLTTLTIEFTKTQLKLIGDAVVWPGHGFASSRSFSGLGVSSDVICMISPSDYQTFEARNIQRIGQAFGGAVFHSCGQWTSKIDGVKTVPNLIMVDAAFSKQTDPDPNPCAPFRDAFKGTGIVINARIVGDSSTVLDKVQQLWNPDIKLIVVTYCRTAEDQKSVYDAIHRLAEE